VKEECRFPWGIYVGDIEVGSDYIPICLDSKEGGLVVFFDDDSEDVGNNLVENIAINLLWKIKPKELKIEIFDFSIRKRFGVLSNLKSKNLYNISTSSNATMSKFNDLERIVLYRHQELLSNEKPTLSDYNSKIKFKEQYIVVLINLNDYSNDITPFRRFKEFCNSAFDAGVYIIFFGHKVMKKSKDKFIQYILEKYSSIHINNRKVNLPQIPALDFIESFNFEYLNENKDKNITKFIELCDDTIEDGEDFLSIPIGTSADGRVEISFSLGEKSQTYHAFITGTTGTGKTVLLNHIILGIAKKYSAKEIELYLMDYKDGVEFQVFENHPNCKKIFLDNNDLDASIELLSEFKANISKRAELFKKHKVKDINSYNKLFPQTPISRSILIIDEVHKLFGGSYQNISTLNELLSDVVRQGRSYGIAIILSTQSISGTNIDDRLIMSQISLRVSYKLSSERDCEKIFGYGNYSPMELNKYELIYNANSGVKNSNILCKVYPPEDITLKIDELLKSIEPRFVLKPQIVTSYIKTQTTLQNKEKNQKTPLIEIDTTTQGSIDMVEYQKEILKRLKEEGYIS